ADSRAHRPLLIDLALNLFERQGPAQRIAVHDAKALQRDTEAVGQVASLLCRLRAPLGTDRLRDVARCADHRLHELTLREVRVRMIVTVHTYRNRGPAPVRRSLMLDP